jgi:hypothetical protein
VDLESGKPLTLLDWAVWMRANGGERAWNAVLATILKTV